MLGIGELGEPVGRVDEPFGEQVDVEAQLCRARIDYFFVQRQQVDQQGSQLRLVQHARHISIAGAVPAAAAAVRKQYDPPGFLGQG
jgi:hypothetical protein